MSSGGGGRVAVRVCGGGCVWRWGCVAVWVCGGGGAWRCGCEVRVVAYVGTAIPWPANWRAGKMPVKMDPLLGAPYLPTMCIITPATRRV